jgi:hypothetical protein
VTCVTQNGAVNLIGKFAQARDSNMRRWYATHSPPPRENVNLIWPHCARFIWPHLRCGIGSASPAVILLRW